jgi:hypothetical protein
VTGFGFAQKFFASLQSRAVHFAKHKNPGKASATKTQALVLILAVVALFCVVYVLTLWLQPN